MLCQAFLILSPRQFWIAFRICRTIAVRFLRSSFRGLMVGPLLGVEIAWFGHAHQVRFHSAALSTLGKRRSP
jgi:hypothetical protein